MPSEEDELLPISALQHFVFCRRQCALIHLEQAWADNRLTAEGNLQHARVISGESTTRGPLRVLRSLPLASPRLGLTGYADVVEIHQDAAGGERAFPVEYKHGRSKAHDADRVQLCAQALCLEDMLGLPVPEGALFYATPKRREVVAIDDTLRERTLDCIAELRRMMESRAMPPAEPGPKCRACSLAEICRPGLATAKSAGAWLERARLEA
jgi:CRISPR-associated exonuclease Cas4